ncbi:MAG: Tn3 family transposase [Acidimicrobiales bacterium]
MVADRGGFISAAERVALERFPLEVDDDALGHFLLTDSDLALIGRRYGSGGRLAGGLQIGAVRWLGFVPGDLSTAPPELVALVADQVGVNVSALGSYSDRDQTRSDHVTAVEQHLGFRRADRGDLKALSDWLVERALEHDRPLVLFRLGCEHLHANRVVRPGITTIERAVVAARQRATEETYLRIAPQLDTHRRRQLAELLEVDQDLGLTPWVWLRREAPSSIPAAIKEQIAKVELLRDVGADQLDLSVLNPNRVRHLATVGLRMTPQALDRLAPARRYQILASTVVEELTARLDEVLDLFDIALATVERAARLDDERATAAGAKTAIETVRAFNQVASVVLDHDVPDDQVRATILERIGRRRFEEVTTRAAELDLDNDGYLGRLRARYTRLRQFAPGVLAAFEFHSATPDDELLAGVRLLQDLNRTRSRLVPATAATGFAPTRWRRHFTDDEGRIDRHSWEVCLLLELRGALRGANVWVEHSRRYRNPADYLIPTDRWERLRPEFPEATGIPLEPRPRLAQLGDEVNRQLAELDTVIGDAETVRIEDGRLVVPSLEAQEADPTVDEARQRINSLLPEVDLVDVLVEVDHWCGFLDQLRHADHATPRTEDHRQRLLAALMAHGCNFGIDTMARLTTFTADQLAWTNTWHLRTDTVRAANDHIVNHQIQQPLAQHWGTGTLSSSDGQRFPVAVRSPRARRMRRYFTGTGATIYTWTSDRHAQYGTRVIPTTVREATYVLDAIFDNETDLAIEEHTTDTAGYTDLVFGLFDLTGLRFSPRIRDLADQRLWRLATTETKGQASGLLQHRIRPDRFINRWDDMLRVAATIRYGYLPASTLVSKLQASARQNQLTQAIQEYGRIVKTISILRYLHNDDHRRRIHDQLNKGESLHALRRQLFFANQGQINRRDSGDQDLQGECLTLLTNAIVCWNTVYMQAALEHLTATDHGLVDDDQRRLSPVGHEHINFYGRYDLANRHPPDHGLRPLRTN